MNYIKFTLFVVVAIIFVFSLFILFSNRNTQSVVTTIGIYVNYIATIVAIIAGVITVIILLNSPNNYFYTFLIILSIAFLIILFGQINDYSKQQKINQYHTWYDQLENQKIDIWKNIHNPIKVEELLSEIKKSELDNFNQYNIFKASIYFTLSENDENFYSKYEAFTKEHNLNRCHVIKEFLKANTPNTEEDYLRIFKALPSPHEGLDYCIPPNQDGIHNEDFYFNTLYAKGYKQAALQSLHQKIKRPSKYIEQIKKLDDLDYRYKALAIIIKNTDFSKFRLQDFYKLILEQKKEKHFDSYTKLFANTLSTFNFEKTEFVNQKENFVFMQLYQLLGKEHPFFKALPEEYIQKQVSYQKENEGKPFIEFVQFFSQVVNLEHAHPIDGSEFYIEHKNKLIYKGVSNQYGCVSFKSYHLKPTDTIEVRVDNFHYKNQVGWQQLLPAWNTEEGAKARFYAMGHHPEHGNIYQIYGNGKTNFTVEIAEKIRKDFDYFYDVKWQE